MCQQVPVEVSGLEPPTSTLRTEIEARAHVRHRAKSAHDLGFESSTSFIVSQYFGTSRGHFADKD
jgi:hypothetical protein